ncbi:MAG: carbon-nitrogen hydrolase family protein [Desulfarculus sp.]|nr:carbon-nitrogen hydrolase family protein [Desulfarculus sp.]
MKAAVLQMNSGRDRAANLEQAASLLAQAASQGARLAVLPEHFACLVPEGQPHPHPEPLNGPTLAFLADQARRLGLWIVGGSLAEKGPGGKTYNTSPLLDDQGRLVAVYRKIHLFDLALPGQPAWLESRLVVPGRRLALADTPLGRLGMSICFDLRFPELYRRLRLKGAEILAAPSAFTLATGRDHWELLLKARALDNQCHLLAGAQWGDHGQERVSFGSAMIVDPWGQVLARCPEGVGLAVAEIDPQRREEIRQRLDTAQLARLLPAAWSRG